MRASRTRGDRRLRAHTRKLELDLYGYGLSFNRSRKRTHHSCRWRGMGNLHRDYFIDDGGWIGGRRGTVHKHLSNDGWALADDRTSRLANPIHDARGMAGRHKLGHRTQDS